MQILTINFLMYTVCGIWRPIDWSSNAAKLLYDVFIFITLVMIYFFMITQFMDIIFVVDNIDDFISNILICLSMVSVCCKATTAVVRRDEIINLVQILLKEPCKPQNQDEIVIQTKFDNFIRSCSIKYLFLVLTSFTSGIVRSVLNVMQGHLPFRVWLPYNCNISLMFWITFMQQIMALTFGTIINIGTETLVFGFILQTCAQFEIFENRLHKLIISKTTKYMGNSPDSLNKDKAIISGYIHHHLSIYKYAEAVNIVFNQVFFVQFFGSILVLCAGIYYLSAHFNEAESTTLIMYTISMFVQIYIYCWSGNEVMLKSKNIGDAIYCMDWPLLSTSDKKDLWMIMIRSTIPIKFTSSFLIILSLQSYGNILKTSYSAFNMLQQA